MPTRALRFLILLALLLPLQPAATAASRPDKIDSALLARAQVQGQVEFLAVLAEQADLSPAAALTTREAKGAYVYHTLTSQAARTQAPLRALLETRGAAYKPYWIANMLWVQGDAAALQALAARPEVARLIPNARIIREPAPLLPPTRPGALAPQTVELNLTQVNAPALWAMGITGQGVVIGGQDTGYQWDHPALIGQYRGWDGSTADHNHNWFDAIGGNADCPNPLVPCDDDGHGTHTMGTMLGDDGGANQIGVAPGARWIGCRNMDEGVGSLASYSDCFQWFLAPTDLSGANPDPAKAPHVINNSWSCPTFETGCEDPLAMLPVVASVRAAGILVVVSASNNGALCGTVADPPAIYDEAFSVGAVDASDNIAGFSSWGPVGVDGSGRLKPDVVAPGVNVRSSWLNSGYTSLNGTSMAAPHVAGLAALIISADPSLAGQVDRLEDLLRFSAAPLTSTATCGGIPGSRVPNHTYGFGRVDALQAHARLSMQPKYFPLVRHQP